MVDKVLPRLISKHRCNGKLLLKRPKSVPYTPPTEISIIFFDEWNDIDKLPKPILKEGGVMWCSFEGEKK